MIGKRLIAVLATVMFLLAAGCAETPKSPQTPQIAHVPDYPESRYLVATGYGDTPTEAAREARSAMAAIFSSTVYGETMARATSAFGLDGEEQFQKQVASTVSVITSVALEGVRIVDGGKDEKTGAYKSLAVLDRRQAGAQWQQEVDAIDERLTAEMAALPSVKGDLFRLAALNRIAALAVEQEALTSRLRVVGASTAMAHTVDLQPVATELAALRQKAAVFVSLDGEQSTAAANVIKAGLSREGVLITNDAAAASGRITGTVLLQPLNIDNPMAQFIRAVITADISDAGTGVSLKSVTARVRKASADEAEAARMAVNAASEQIAVEIAAALGHMGWTDAAPQ